MEYFNNKVLSFYVITISNFGKMVDRDIMRRFIENRKKLMKYNTKPYSLSFTHTHTQTHTDTFKDGICVLGNQSNTFVKKKIMYK